MPMSPAEELVSGLEGGTVRIGGSEAERRITRWQALRSSNKDWIAAYVRWNADRPYRVDPLPKRISVAFGDFLYGEDPQVLAADADDNDNLSYIVEKNKLAGAWRRRADQCSAEGEVWWRIHVDKSVRDVPIISWWSRRNVRPLFWGDELVAAAVIMDMGTNDVGRWRLVEVHEKGYVYNRLYVKAKSQHDAYVDIADDPENEYCDLGDNRPLEAHPLTMDIDPEFAHGLEGMLIGRVVNEIDDDSDVGVSDYQGIEGMILDLNEAHCIDAENFRLAGKKRVVMPRKFAKERGPGGTPMVDVSEDILFSEDDGDEMDSGDGLFKILEYNYDGASSIARKEDLTVNALTRVGLARQLVDPNTTEGGGAASGIALRTRLIPTTATVNGKGREWDDSNPTMLFRAMQLDAMDPGSGGFGRSYNNLTDPPSVERKDPLPQDQTEVDNRHINLVGAGVESIEESIRQRHPDWPDLRLTAEVQRILANRDNAGVSEDGFLIESPVAVAVPAPPAPDSGQTSTSEMDQGVSAGEDPLAV